MLSRAIVTGVLTLIVVTSHAQGYQQTPSAQRIAEGQRLFDHYNASMRNKGAAAREYLDGAYANGIAQSPENVRTVRALLATNLSTAEKVGLTRILGRLYTKNDMTGMNAAIIQDLKGLVNSGDREIARAAAMTFSRTDHFPDSADVLLRAKNNGAISNEDYHGELAHHVAVAPQADQAALVRILRAGKVGYAMEILALVSSDPSRLERIYPETKQSLYETLLENEPSFTMALGEFGLTDASRYTYWLEAVALLGSRANRAKYAEIVVDRLNDARLDPRKAMAFLASPQGKALVAEV